MEYPTGPILLSSEAEMMDGHRQIEDHPVHNQTTLADDVLE
jgi:hypothetical protein